MGLHTGVLATSQRVQLKYELYHQKRLPFCSHRGYKIETPTAICRKMLF
jgi:hypothetical protein